MKVIAKPISMIAVFDENGDFKPIRFKIAAEDESDQVIKVRRINTKAMQKMAGMKTMVYTCLVAINNVEKICEVRYELDTCKWTLFKI